MKRWRVSWVGTMLSSGQHSEFPAGAPTTRMTGTAFARALELVDEISAYRLGRLKRSQFPPNCTAALVRYGGGS